LKAHKEEHKNCLVPFNHKDSNQLGEWVATHRTCKVSQDRVELLEKIGFVFDAQEAKWPLCYTQLKACKEPPDDCPVSLNYKDDKQLGE